MLRQLETIHRSACSPFTCSGGLLFKTGQDGFEKCVFDELADDLPCAGFRIPCLARDIRSGSNLLLRPALQKLGDPSDQHLVHLMTEAPPTVFLSVVDLHILEERLDIAGNGSISDVQLRGEGKDAGGNVKIPVGAQHIVHRRQLGIPNFYKEIEIGAALLRPERSGCHCAAVSHESRVQSRLRWSLGKLV